MKYIVRVLYILSLFLKSHLQSRQWILAVGPTVGGRDGVVETEVAVLDQAVRGTG